MKTFSSIICALTCVLSFSTIGHAMESKAQTVSPLVDNLFTNNIDMVLNELSRQQSSTESLLKVAEDNQSLTQTSSLAQNSGLLNASVSNSSYLDLPTTDMLSRMTLVASNSVNRFKQSGRASWYGGKLQGRKTASGERFNMNSLTAAHPSLPFNTFVKVTNKDNGKSVVVKINDRGPFVGKRIIDLSKAAAKKIGIVSRGVGNVSVVKVTAP